MTAAISSLGTSSPEKRHGRRKHRAVCRDATSESQPEADRSPAGCRATPVGGRTLIEAACRSRNEAARPPRNQAYLDNLQMITHTYGRWRPGSEAPPPGAPIISSPIGRLPRSPHSRTTMRPKPTASSKLSLAGMMATVEARCAFPHRSSRRWRSGRYLRLSWIVCRHLEDPVGGGKSFARSVGRVVRRSSSATVAITSSCACARPKERRAGRPSTASRK